MGSSIFLALLSATATADGKPPAAAVVLMPTQGVNPALVSVIEDAIAQAATESFGPSTKGPAETREDLGKAQLKKLQTCDAGPCWRKASAKLGVDYLVLVTVLASKDQQLWAVKVVSLKSGKIEGRHQHTGRVEVVDFLSAAREVLRKAGEPAGLTAALGSTPAAAPVSVAAAAAQPAPAPAPPTYLKAEEIPAGLWPLPAPEPLPPNDPRSRPPENVPLSRVHDAEWTAGIGFVRRAGEAGSAPVASEVAALRLPEPSLLGVDESSLNWALAYETSEFEDAALDPVAMYGSDLAVRFQWRDLPWFVSPWLELEGGFRVNTNTADKAGMLRLMTTHLRFGLDIVPVPYLGFGPFAAGSMSLWRGLADDDGGPLGMGYGRELGGHVRLGLRRDPAQSESTFYADFAYVKRTHDAKFAFEDDDVEAELAIDYWRLELGYSILWVAYSPGTLELEPSRGESSTAKTVQMIGGFRGVFY